VSPPALARLERILLIVPWLLEHPGAEVAEVTERFGISEAELADDLDVLGYCGLPGYGGGDLVETSIVGDRVTVRLAHFFRRPLRLSVREALALLLAGRALADLGGLAESAALRRAVLRVEESLGAAPGLAIDIDAPGTELLPSLRAAVADRRVVALRYRAAGGQVTDREVEPWALVGAAGAWYLQGWCRLARGPRDFRLDRIVGADVTDDDAGPLPHQPPPPPVYVPSPGDAEAVLELDPAAWWLPERLVVDAVEEVPARDDAGPVRRVRLRTRSPDWLAAQVLSLSPAVRVVQPPQLAERVAELAQRVLDRHGSDGGTALPV